MELRKRFSHTPPQGEISVSGISLIMKLVADQRLISNEWKELNPETSAYVLPALPSDWTWSWMQLRGEYRGTFPKRVAQYYKKAHNIKCPEKFLESVGNLARRHAATDESDITFEFVDVIDWDAGGYGDGGSCWWDDHAGAQDMHQHNGGFAVRLYDAHGDGFGRAWLVGIDDDMWLVFNGYGFVSDSTLVIARIVAAHMGKSYKSISLENNGDSRGVYWIDGGKAYLLGTPEQIEPITHYDLEWENMYRSMYRCYECGTQLDEYEVYSGVDDHDYCERCHSRLFSSCYHCGEDRYADDIRRVGDDYICDYCIDNDFTECEKCEKIVPNSQIREVDDQALCVECAPTPAPRAKK